MFTKTSATELMFDAEIQATLVKMKDLEKDSAEYAKLLEHVSKLHKLKAEEQPKKVNPDTKLIVAANIVGILAILNHERLHPITSKAMNFVAKPW
jgi:hypothetical protein